MPAVLIVDDERDIVEALKIYLSTEKYDILCAYTGKQAIDVVKNHQVDLILMDIMMPEMDGITATHKLRELTNVPIILLTAKSEEGDKVLGLNIGADDYITKPFNPIEVVARVKSQLRRYLQLGAKQVVSDVYECGDIELDDNRKKVTVMGKEVDLTPMEYGILKLLIMHPGKVYSSDDIYREVWEDTPIKNDGVVSVHIRHLREKIEVAPSNPRYIKVVWGQGYKMEDGYDKR